MSTESTLQSTTASMAMDPYYVAIFAFAVGAQGVFGNLSLTEYVRNPGFASIAGLANLADPPSEQLQQLKALYNAAFGNAIVQQIPHLIDTQLPHVNKYGSIWKNCSIMLIIVALFVALRAFAKLYVLRSTRRLRLDDWLLFAAFALSAAASCEYSIDLHNNGGYVGHVWDLPYEKIAFINKMGYIGWVIRIPTVWLIKMSFLVFYKSICPTRVSRIVCIFTAVWITLGTIVLLFLTIFQCKPVSDYWKNMLTAKCLHVIALSSSMSIFNTVSASYWACQRGMTNL